MSNGVTTRTRGRRRSVLTAAIAVAAAAITTAAPAQAADGDVPRTGEELTEALTELLPAGLETSGAIAEGVDDSDYPFVSLTADDGAGGVDMTLDLSRWATDDWHDIAGCQGWGELPEGDPGTFTCEDTVLPDGSILSLITTGYEEEGVPEEGGEPSRSATWEVWLEGPGSSPEEPGGRAVVLTEFKDLAGVEDPDAYAPPLDLGQLAEIVQQPVWQDVLDAVDEEYGPPADIEFPGTDIPATELRDTFRALAPEGLEITDGADDEAGFATLLADDGEGPGLVDISTWGPDGGESDELVIGELEPGAGAGVESGTELEFITESGAEFVTESGAEFVTESGAEFVTEPGDEVFASAEPVEGTEPVCEDSELEDGTLISVCEWPASEGDPYVLNMVDVTYPDGSGLSISALNAADWESDPTRADAPLSGAELAEIASADEWRSLFD